MLILVWEAANKAAHQVWGIEADGFREKFKKALPIDDEVTGQTFLLGDSLIGDPSSMNAADGNP